MNSEETTPECVDEVFRYLLEACNSRRASSIFSPEKYSIRLIGNYREKYDGLRWRLVCTWNDHECTNFSVSNKLCTKHNKEKRNKTNYSSLPNVCNQTVNDENQINKNKTNSTIKSEFSHFKQFSIDSDDDDMSSYGIKPELLPSSSSNPHTDIEYIGSRTCTNELNITELLSKHIPPLTDFEENIIGDFLIQNFSTTCSMLDAQLYLHDEAARIVNKNYRFQMDTISSEYFYDFLLRHPRIAVHYKNWFSQCKLSPPTTGCLIDTKMWILSMMVRGTLISDE